MKPVMQLVIYNIIRKTLGGCPVGICILVTLLAGTTFTRIVPSVDALFAASVFLVGALTSWALLAVSLPTITEAFSTLFTLVSTSIVHTFNCYALDLNPCI
jgi:hypothetical protein